MITGDVLSLPEVRIHHHTDDMIIVHIHRIALGIHQGRTQNSVGHVPGMICVWMLQMPFVLVMVLVTLFFMIS